MKEKEIIKGEFSQYINIVTVLFDIFAAFWIPFGYIMYVVEDYDTASIGAGFGFAFLTLIVGHIIGSMVSNVCSPKITVTNKRVYGKDVFCKRVDLPIDMISSVATSIFNGISIATSSGRITFWFCKNRDEIFEEISKLLLERQEKPHTINENTVDVGTELKKYKELFDEGVITQEEFELKKKQLLGI